VNTRTSETNCKVWLLLAREGGYWSMPEIRDHGIELGGNANRRLDSMTRNGALKKIEGAKYGVTPECRFPNGLTLKQVLEATR
jgi:hypothetical protein